MNLSTVQSGNHSLRRGPARGRTGVRPLSFPQEEWHRCTLQESEEFGDFKWGLVPEIEMHGHRLGEHSVRMETRETKVIAFP